MLDQDWFRGIAGLTSDPDEAWRLLGLPHMQEAALWHARWLDGPRVARWLEEAIDEQRWLSSVRSRSPAARAMFALAEETRDGRRA